MKEIAAITACLAVLFFSQTAFAQDSGGRLGIGADVSYMAVADTGESTKVVFDAVALVGANLTYYAGETFSLEVSIGYSQLDVDAEGNGMAFSLGRLKQLPVLLTGRFHLPMKDGRISPYFGGGIGYYFNEFDTSEIVALAGGTLDPDNGVAFHLSTGIELFIWEHASLSFDLKYIWNETAGNTTIVGVTTSDDLDLNTFLGGIGFTYYFELD